MSVEERDQKGYLNMYGLDASLKRLGLEYIDLLQIHRFDPNTPIKETMKALHDVVESGKVRYIGASSMEFISMQNLHNATYREEEREMIPAIKKFGMGMIPWSPVAMGYLCRPHDTFMDSARGTSMNGTFVGNKWMAADEKINRKVEEIAKKRGTKMAVVALAWSLSKPFMTAPIIGMSKSERVDEAIEAVSFELTKQEIESIDELYEPKKTMGFA